MNSARIALAVLATALALLPGALSDHPAEASPLSMATVALEGDPMTVPPWPPGRPLGGTYQLADFSGSHVNENGDVAFATTTTGTPSPEPCVLLRGSAGGPPPTLIAADGDEAPPLPLPLVTPQPVDVCYPFLNLPTSDPMVNNNGDIAYKAYLRTDGRWSLWVRPYGMTISNLVAVQGEGDPLGYTYGEPELLDFNDNGYVLFQTDRGGAPPNTLWLWDGFQPTPTTISVVTEGDSLGGGIYVNTLGGGGGGGGAATMNNNADVAWRVTTTGGGGGGGGGIYTGTASSPTKVVEAGDLWFSGPPVGDVDFTEVSEPRILDDGSVIFRAIADSPYDDGYFRAEPAGGGIYTYEKLVLEADPNPETGSTWGSLVAPSARNGQGGEVMLSADDGTSSETLYLYPSYDRLAGVGDTSPAGQPYADIESASVNEKNLSVTGVVVGPVASCGPGLCDGIFGGGTATDNNSVTIAVYPDFDTDGLSHTLETDTNPVTCGIDSDRDGSVDFSFDLDSDGSCDVDFAVPDIFVEMDYMDCTVTSGAPDNLDPKDVDNDMNLLEPDGMPDDDLPNALCSGGSDTHNHKPLGGIIEGGAAGPLGVYSCEDGVDNDLDTLTDLDDPDCSVVAAFADAPVHNIYSNEDGIATCGDGVDNGGGDGIDTNDADCHTDGNVGNPGSYDASRIEDKFLGTCNDGVDNNLDGKTDAGIDVNGNYVYTDPGDSPPDDDCTGINLHVVVDEALAHADNLDWAGAKVGGNACVNGVGYHPNHSAFELVKAYHFGSVGDNAATLAAKRLLFHYSLSTHRQTVGNTSSGCGEMPGNDFYVSLGGWTNVTATEHEATFMHELGHNLNLCHAGPRKLAVPDSQCDFNYKPNYLSVMNYTFSFPWTPDGQATGRKLDYSRVALPPGDPLIALCPAGGAGAHILTENALLDEPDGIDCGITAAVPAGWPKTAYTYVSGMSCPFKVVPSTGGIDWNMIGGLTVNVTAPINDAFNPAPPPPSCFATPNPWLTPLKGYNDWPFLLYNFRGTPGYGDGLPTAPVPPDEPGSVPPPDTDTDGYHDGQDNCPTVPNPGQTNTDADLAGAGASVTGDADGDTCDDEDDNESASQTQDPGASAGTCPPGTLPVWADCVETYLGTAIDDNCTGSPGPGGDAWPPDINIDKDVNILDVFPMFGGWLQSVPPAAIRHDLNADGTVNILDVFPMFPVWLDTCT